MDELFYYFLCVKECREEGGASDADAVLNNLEFFKRVFGKTLIKSGRLSLIDRIKKVPSQILNRQTLDTTVPGHDYHMR